MNIVAKKFNESDIEWTNARLSSLSKQYGGPESFISFTYQTGYDDGYLDAVEAERLKNMIIIGASALSITGIGFIAGYLYKKLKVQKRRIELQLEDKSKEKAEKFVEKIVSE